MASVLVIMVMVRGLGRLWDDLSCLKVSTYQGMSSCVSTYGNSRHPVLIGFVLFEWNVNVNKHVFFWTKRWIPSNSDNLMDHCLDSSSLLSLMNLHT